MHWFQEILTSGIIKCRDEHRRVHPKDVSFNLRTTVEGERPDAFDGYLLISVRENDDGPTTPPTDITIHMKPTLQNKVPAVINPMVNTVAN